MSPRIAAAVSIAVLGALAGCGSAPAPALDTLRVRTFRVPKSGDLYIETRWVETKVEPEERVVQAPALVMRPGTWARVFVGEDPTGAIGKADLDPGARAPSFGEASGFLTLVRCDNLDALIELKIRAYLLQDGVATLTARGDLLVESEEERELALARPPG